MLRSGASNTPVYAPLYPHDMKYGSNDVEAISVLLEVEKRKIERILEYTPFEFVSPHVWADISVFRSAYGIKPFGNGGIIIPAKYKETVGGFYAYCYVDTDEALALGREPWGYPKKYADIYLQRTGRAATAATRRSDANFEVSVVVNGRADDAPHVPRSPFLLLQVLPSAESPDVLLKRVIARDTDTTAKMSRELGDGAFEIKSMHKSNELEWLSGSVPIIASYNTGSFTGVYGSVLGIEEIGPELQLAISGY